MHDLLLFGQIPESRFGQLTEILAGLTALPEPRTILERRYIFRPKRAPVQKIEQLGGSQNITDVHKAARKQKADEDSRYCTLVEDLTLNAHQLNGGGKGDVHSTETRDNISGESRTRFTVHTSDLPEPEIKSVMSLDSNVTTVKDDDDALASMESQGQRFVHQYIVEGRQFVFNNVVIRLQRCMEIVSADGQGEAGPQTPMEGCITRPWDKSGSYILEACVTISDGKNPDLVGRGTDELRRLKEDLRGCVELRTVERFSMDPRAR